MLLFFTGIAISGNFRPKSLPYLPETAIIIGAVAAMLTLPTSVIFMSTGVLSCWLFMRCYPTKKMVLTMGGTGIFILSYLLSNFSKFQTGRQWGIAITSVEKFSNFIFETQQALLPFGLLILSAVGIFIPAFKQKIEYRRLWLLLIPVLVFVSALATKAGPPRVYLPLTACYALFSGLGAVCLLDYLENYQKLNRIAKLPMILLLVTIAVFGYFSKYNDPQWRLPDWKKIFSDISTNVPIETFVVYRSNDSFPVLQNNAPQIYRDHLRRMSNRSENRLLLMFDAVGNFNVANPEQSEWVCHYSTVKPIKQLAFDNTVATLYQMKRLRKPSELQLPVVAFIGPVATSTIQSIASELNCQRILELNIWLNTVTRNVNGIQYRAVALLLSPEHISANLFKRLQPYGEAVALYQVQ